MKKSFIIIGIIALLVIVGLGYFLMQKPSYPNTNSQNPTSENPSGTTPEGTPIQTHNIELKNFAFSPSQLTIQPGDTVIWTNHDLVHHTVTSDSGSELNSDFISNGQTYSHTFNTVGTFTYHCTPHQVMKGAIIVE